MQAQCRTVLRLSRHFRNTRPWAAGQMPARQRLTGERSGSKHVPPPSPQRPNGWSRTTRISPSDTPTVVSRDVVRERRRTGDWRPPSALNQLASRRELQGLRSAVRSRDRRDLCGRYGSGGTREAQDLSCGSRPRIPRIRPGPELSPDPPRVPGLPRCPRPAH